MPKRFKIPLLLLVVAAVAVAVYFLPPVHSRLAWRVDAARAKIKYALQPPEQVIFRPGEQQGQEARIETIVAATLGAVTLPAPASATPAATAASLPTQREDATPLPMPSPTPTPTPLPEQVFLKGARHEYQQWNNCGPATLSMALSFWEWEGDQRDTAAYLKPNPRDKNVMPYEMAAFVNEMTDLKAVWRVGGNLDLLKRMLAAGYPVVVEKGFEGPGFDGWMGHYGLLTGYDEAKSVFWVFDSYEGPDSAFTIPYARVQDYWPHFNGVYIIIYPPEKEAEVMALLGEDADKDENYRRAAAEASNAIFAAGTPREQYFAWFNRGDDLVYLDDYGGAAEAYDQAFAIYPQIPEEKRPWRVMWYRTGPYWAYFYTQRYYDVIGLATATLGAMSEPVLEESFYWRGLAREATGDVDGALADLREAVRLNPNFSAAQYHLNRLESGQ